MSSRETKGERRTNDSGGGVIFSLLFCCMKLFLIDVIKIMTLSSENGNQMNIASGYSIFLKTLTLGIQSVKPLKKNCSIRDKRN